MMGLRYRNLLNIFRPTLFLTTVVAACVVAVLLTTGTAMAQTVAYWSFEEGGAGTQPSNQGGVHGGAPTPILDSSANAYHMGTLDVANAPTYTSSVAGPTVAQFGTANNRALDFDGVSNEIYATGYTSTGLNDIDFSTGWTVETSFRFDTIPDRLPGPDSEVPNENSPTFHQGVLAKTGKPVSNKGEPPLLFRVRNDGDHDDDDDTLDDTKHLEVRGLDGSGDDWNMDSRLTSPLVVGQWYHAAAVYNGTTTDLYLDSGNGYKWQDNTAMKTDGWFGSVADWVIGRGEWNGNPAWSMDGQVDEVRISSTALTPQEFLHSSPSDYDDLVTYTIDPSQSNLAWSGTALGIPMAEQFAGSLTAALEGNISAHLNGNTLTFDDLSDIDPQAFPGSPFEPALGSSVTIKEGTPDEDIVTFPATGEDNFGFFLEFLPGINLAAVRDLKFGISDGSADFGGPVTGLEIRTKSSRIDFQTQFFGDDASADLQSGAPGPNIAAENMTRDRDPGTQLETISIPLDLDILTDDFDTNLAGVVVAARPWNGDFNVDGIVDGADYLTYQLGYGTLYDDLDLTIWEQNFGTIIPAVVAAVVPEPSSFVLVLLLGIVRLRSRRR